MAATSQHPQQQHIPLQALALRSHQKFLDAVGAAVCNLKPPKHWDKEPQQETMTQTCPDAKEH